jgi:acyl-CoA synthetase (AMP-forming)/AMP-acid ligase II/thioesterase domain-containing protein
MQLLSGKIGYGTWYEKSEGPQMHSSDVSQGEAGLCEGTSELRISGLQEEVGRTHQPDGFQSLGDAIRFHATSQPNQSAILSSAFSPLSYRQLQQQIEGIGSQLRQIGLRREARIGIALPDGPEAVLAIVAVSCCAIAVPFDPKLTPAEIDQRLGILRLDAIILGEASNSSVRSVAERRGVGIVEAFSVGGGQLGLTLDAPAGDFPAPPERPDSSAVAFILQTSGTTALPKLIPFSHGNMLAAAKRLQTWFTLTALDRCLSVSPPYYSHGLKVTVFTPLLTGGSLALPSSRTAINFSEWFEILSPTWYSASPTLHRVVLDAARANPGCRTMHSLRLAVSGGAHLQPEVRDGLQDTLSIPVLEHYGCSEAAQIAANLPLPGQSKPGTCGKPWPGTLVVVGEDGLPMPPGEHGEILVGGPTLTSGYLDDPELNRTAFVDGWLRMGDLGSLDHEGFLTVHGRIKDLINRGGEKISPVEVDMALLRHPAVAEAAAFATPHPRLGEDVAAAVVLHPGVTTTPAELRHFLTHQIASFKIPRRITILDHLPKGTTGKVLRRQLAETLTAPTSDDFKDPASAVPATKPLSANLELELLTLWRQLLQNDSLGIDDDLFESGGDSLIATQVILEIERMVGHPVNPSILLEAPTIRTLVLNLGSQAELQSDSVIHLHASGDRCPFLFFHGGLGVAYYLGRLAPHLGADQPILAIEPHGLQGDTIPGTIEEMAADRVKLILQKQPSGPYRIGGFCNGALVAYEAARLLMATGHNVEMLVLIDPPSVNARALPRMILSALNPLSDRAATSAWCWMVRAEKLSVMSWRQRWALLQTERWAKKMNRKVTGSIRAGAPGAAPVVPELLPTDGSNDIVRQYASVMARYHPKSLDVPAIFYSADYDGRGWRRLLPDLEIIRLPGGHLQSVTDNVGDLANHLRGKLRKLGDVASA